MSVFGGLYLMWLGARLVRRSRRAGSAEAAPASPADTTPPDDLRRTALLGLVTALSNAQAILFITSIFAVSGVLHANAATGVATVLIIIACNASYLSVLGWLFQRERMRAGYARYRGVLEAATGSLFMVFGGRLLWRALVR